MKNERDIKKQELKKEEKMDILDIIGMDNAEDNLDKIGQETHLTWLQTAAAMQAPIR